MLNNYYKFINDTPNPKLTDSIIFYIIIAIIALAAFLFIKIYDIVKKKSRSKRPEKAEKAIFWDNESTQKTPCFETRDDDLEEKQRTQPEDEIRKVEYRNSYQPKYLLTIHEKTQFRKLAAWAETNNLYVFTKVRLADLIEPRRGQNNFKSLFWKIQAKHVDFVICNKDLIVICIIELQDSSHYRPDRIERDLFVKEVLEACRYRFIQTHSITEDMLTKITPQK